jgi:hypothetical protein
MLPPRRPGNRIKQGYGFIAAEKADGFIDAICFFVFPKYAIDKPGRL